MQWPPQIRKGALDKVAAKAMEFQRTAFLRLLRVDHALRLEDPEDQLSEEVSDRVKVALSERADGLIKKHTPQLPDDCKRSMGHLQVAALAIAAPG